MKNSFCTLSRLVVLVLAATGPLSAQTYKLNWFTIEGGGGTSAAGPFSLNGTAGQPGAGAANGGSYSLASGFWGGLTLIQSPGAPLLRIEKLANDAARISWETSPTRWLLERTSAIGTNAVWSMTALPYQTNGGQVSVIITNSVGEAFFRLRR